MKKEFHKCHVPLITAYRQMQENEALKEMPQAKPLIEGFVIKCHYIAVSGAFAGCMDARHNVYIHLRGQASKKARHEPCGKAAQIPQQQPQQQQQQQQQQQEQRMIMFMKAMLM
uniref:Uncharacterized protein n=1 Tax=Glossina austeni TaxID=7395 RepID=A0A1A9UEY5_GLOAU